MQYLLQEAMGALMTRSLQQVSGRPLKLGVHENHKRNLTREIGSLKIQKLFKLKSDKIYNNSFCISLYPTLSCQYRSSPEYLYSCQAALKLWGWPGPEGSLGSCQTGKEEKEDTKHLSAWKILHLKKILNQYFLKQVHYLKTCFNISEKKLGSSALCQEGLKTLYVQYIIFIELNWCLSDTKQKIQMVNTILIQ